MSSRKKGPASAGPFASRRLKLSPGPSKVSGLVAAELVVQADASHEELAAVVAAADGAATDRCTIIRYADDVVGKGAAVVAVEVDPEGLELGGQVIGEGVLDTRAEHPTDIIAVIAVCDCRRSEPGGLKSLTSKEPANRRREDDVLLFVVVREGETTSGVDQGTVERVADTDTSRPPPVAATGAVVAVAEQEDIVTAGYDRGGDARSEPLGNRQRGNGREPASEEAAVAVVTAEPLDVGLETKDEARPWRELIVVADLDAPRPAVATAAASAEAQDPPAERDDRSTGAQEEGGCVQAPGASRVMLEGNPGGRDVRLLRVKGAGQFALVKPTNRAELRTPRRIRVERASAPGFNRDLSNDIWLCSVDMALSPGAACPLFYTG